MPQPLPVKLIAALSATGAATALALVAAWEGKSNVPYTDIAGVLTVCYGETANVAQRRYTDAECNTLLGQSLIKHWDGIAACSNIASRPVHERIAHLSLAYNVGSIAWCRSSIPYRLSAGMDACAVISQFNKARIGGVLVPVRGLTRRRNAERTLCEGNPQ
jgi:lysozyme